MPVTHNSILTLSFGVILGIVLAYMFKRHLKYNLIYEQFILAESNPPTNIFW